jgi:2-oxo-4-hydroxy-4-carboxy-5-ureidoimidazoline decarboxylase
MLLQQLNKLDDTEARETLTKCCGSGKWVDKMNAARPFSNQQDLFDKADDAWQQCSQEDWLEAFTHHPKIGDVESLKKKFASTSDFASTEQAGVNTATTDIINELALYNEKYEAKFGFIFIVCATGKSAQEMLTLLKQRYENLPEEEIRIAMQEQHKITKIRLQKLIA